MSLLDYDPETGVLCWAKDWWQGIRGAPVRLHRVGHKPYQQARIALTGKLLSYARVCWMRYYGQEPKPLIVDHMDGDPFNNRITNLRLATKTENCRNKKRYTSNTSGKSGVWFNKAYRNGSGLWEAHISIGRGKRRCVGRFATKEEAIEARIKAEEAYGQFRPRDAA